MTSITPFDSNVYSEELYAGVSEEEYAEVMSASAVDEGWQGYAEWSRELESDPVVNQSENFIVRASGKVEHKPEPKSNGRVGGIEI